MSQVKQDALPRSLDHSWFPFRTTAEATGGQHDCKLIVNLILVLQHFPIDAKAPFAVPGAPDRPPPDLGNYTQRESGLGHALWRLTDAIESRALPATFVLERQALPYLTDLHGLLKSPRHSVVAGGEHAVRIHTRAMEREEERSLIAGCLEEIREVIGREAIGWRSPYCSQSPATLELLAEAGVRYVGDFANDDRLYEMTVGGARLVALPMNHFYSDLHFVHSCRQHVDEYAQATIDAARCLAAETHATPAVLSLVVHPWIMGVTHRVNAFANMLDALQQMAGVRFVNSDEIYAAHLAA